MAVDTPATIAIVGAGPIGLEAALYARFLGYTVFVFERGEVAEHVRRWGHVRMFSPFGMNSSSLGRAAVAAQDPQYRPPPSDAVLTGHEWLRHYLLPLSQTDLLADSLRIGCQVRAISRKHYGKSYFWKQTDRRAADGFRLLYVDRHGTENLQEADIVIDASGVYHSPNWMGPGGAPALGEEQLRSHIEYGLPDVLGAQRAEYEGRRVLVVGSGYSAATTVRALCELTALGTGTTVVWVARACREGSGPLPRWENDPLPERDRLAQAANQLAVGHPAVDFRPGWQVTRVSRAQGRFSVELVFTATEETVGTQATHSSKRQEIQVDRIVANVGYRPQWQMCSELQLHLCYVTDGPIRLAAQLLEHNSGNCLAQPASPSHSLLTTEPNFYVLGAKSYGRRSEFLYQHGLEQIRQLFAIIGDRKDLNLYKTAESLPQ